MKKLVLIASLALSSFAALADDASPQCPDNVPANLAPAADQRLRFGHSASGVQIYVCNATPAGSFVWQFIAPQANLFRDDELTATHFIGPTWQGNDGSAVKAAKLAASTVDPTAVPWLLLKSVGNVGPGRFSEITTVQRLNTTGGVAPAASTCNASTVGTLAQVPYTADYFFYDTHAPNHDGNRQCR